MAGDVKRPYRSVVRDQQAEVTRRAVVEAARDLFVAHGYAATSIDDIAAAAQVARRTVYVVGGKPELLKLAYDTALAGDHEQVAVADRPGIQRIVAEPDPVVGMHLYIDHCLAIGARTGPIHVAMRAAAGDERVRVLYDDYQDRRADVARRVVAFLAGRSAPILDPDTAADVLWLLMDPGLYHALVHDRGWSEARMAEWLHATVARQLLGDAPAPGAGTPRS
ncbi:MAG: TetR/AcrR family transcriptional regulator [Pseudonocardia sp.]